MRVLLVSTYELGHQPLHIASPAGALLAAGHEVRCVDLAVEQIEENMLETVDLVAISVPMHTAMRLGASLAERIKGLRPELPVAFYGLYASMSTLDDGPVDALIGGEYEEGLIAWVESGGKPMAEVSLGKTAYAPPARALLPGLERYAHLSMGGRHRLAGYLESSHGCRHRCRHCPIPAVYDGTFRIVDVDSIITDAGRMVDSGAEHLTLGDPDFLNGPHHARRVLRELADRFPDLSYDVTIKVEHLLQHEQFLEEMATLGVVLIVSAFESTNDRILEILDKGHSVDDMARAVEVVRSNGIELRPTWLPFTPWTTFADLVDLFGFLEDHSLFDSVDPIQLTIRLLIPPGSLLIDHPELAGRLGPYDPGRFGYRWESLDPRLDELQLAMSAEVEAGLETETSARDLMERLWTMVLEAAGRPLRPLAIPQGAIEGRPRLTEPWFC